MCNPPRAPRRWWGDRALAVLEVVGTMLTVSVADMVFMPEA